MTTISFTEEELVIHVQGLDKLLAFKGEVIVKFAHIARVEINHEGLMDFKHATFGIGTIYAGKVQAGTFKEDGDKSFWDVHDINKTVLLTLKDDEYSKVIIEVEDPEATVHDIQAKLR